MDKAWRVVERGIIVVGFVVAAATLYYTAATYYQGEHGALANRGAPSMNTPWWIFGGWGLAIALLITGWVMMLTRNNKPKAIPTNLRLQFQPNNLIPICLDIHNIANWYSMRHEMTVQEAPSRKFPQGRQHPYRFWTLHVVFDRPVALKQIVFDGNGAQLPAIEVKDRSPRHAVIIISGDMPAAILDMKVVI